MRIDMCREMWDIEICIRSHKNEGNPYEMICNVFYLPDDLKKFMAIPKDLIIATALWINGACVMARGLVA